MDDNLDDILNGTEPTPEPVEPAIAEPAPEPEAQPEGPARGPDGKFVSKGDKEDAPPASGEFDGKATIGERRRRQEAEQRIAQLEAQLQQLSNPPAPPPDMFENPEGWQSHFGGQIASSAVNQASMNATLNTSEMLARDKFDDFDDMKALFLDLAKENPTLVQQALNDGHPWRKAYQLAKNHEKMTSLGAVDVTDLEAKIRAEIEAKIATEQRQPVAIPQSLAGAGGVPGAAAPYKPPSLDDILR